MSAKKSSSSQLSIEDAVSQIWFKRRQAMMLLEESATELGFLVENGTIKIGDTFTVRDPKNVKTTVVVSDHFSDKNAVWRPMLFERITLSKVKKS